MSDLLPFYANAFDRSGPLKASDYSVDFPEHDIVVYRNHVFRSELYPNGFECLVLVPKAASGAEQKKARPLWKHGESIDVWAPRAQ